jgi:ABC-type polar amino acid transport system ATPase subunit
MKKIKENNAIPGMIKVNQLIKNFDKLNVLKGIDIEVKKGEIVSVVGPSGAGKTTMLQIIGTLMQPDSGSIFINDQDITQLKGKKLAEFRNKNIGFVFQFHIYPVKKARKTLSPVPQNSCIFSTYTKEPNINPAKCRVANSKEWRLPGL